jgi:heme-degrading monooxygenase HmoA
VSQRTGSEPASDGLGKEDPGVLEHAVLDVIPGRETEFELAFAEARQFIASATGFRWLHLARCAERPNRYLLLVGWESLEDHTEGFRGSPAYEEWRRLLHHFYEPFPTVEHFTETSRA